jgi:two-component system KDP operon response regulator KdpE
MSPTRLLLVDDEPQIVRALRPGLTAAGYEVEAADTGKAALAAITARVFDLIILDLGLPDLDGKDFIVQARQQTGVPILVLSARHGEDEKVAALDLGAVDFVGKPFSIGELMARVRAALRSQSAGSGARVELVRDELIADFDARRIRVRGKDIKLSPREAKLLRAFKDRAGQVLTHSDIVTAVWGGGGAIDPQFVRVLVGNLRQKVEKDPARPSIILTEPGQGYRFRGSV